MWVNRPLQVSQLGQLSLLSFLGRQMSSKLESDVCCRLQVAQSGENYGGNRRSAESNGSLLLGLWCDSLHVTCGLTACTPGSAPGPTLGNEYGKTLPFTFLVTVRLTVQRGTGKRCTLSRSCGQTFFPSAIRLWNALPVDICQLPSDSFKTHLSSFAPQIRTHDFWRYINLYVCMFSLYLSTGLRPVFITCTAVFLSEVTVHCLLHGFLDTSVYSLVVRYCSGSSRHRYRKMKMMKDRQLHRALQYRVVQNTYITLRFMDDVLFARNGPYRAVIIFC